MSNNFKELRAEMSPQARERARELAETMASGISQSSGNTEGTKNPAQLTTDDVKPDDLNQK